MSLTVESSVELPLESPSVSGIKYVITNEHDAVQYWLLRGQQWNAATLDVIKTYVEEKHLTHFLNVGAHIGSICLPIALGIQQVTAIEAYPDTYNLLCENIRLNNLTNVNAINVAVGNSEEDIYFMSLDKICPVENINRVINNTGGMHVFTENDIANNIRSANLTDQKITNRMNKLDNLQIDKFDIMLVDIEGLEYDFLLGAEQSISQNKPIIVIEIWSDAKRQQENMTQTHEEVVNYIQSLNYRLVRQLADDYIFEPI